MLHLNSKKSQIMTYFKCLQFNINYLFVFIFKHIYLLLELEVLYHITNFLFKMICTDFFMRFLMIRRFTIELLVNTHLF